MGLAADLGYEMGQQNIVQKSVVAVASTRAMSNMNRKILGPIDRFTMRLTGGRSSLTSWATGIPTVWLTVTGARSGAPRTVPLLGIPVGSDLALIGSSFGQKATPAWVHNLEANSMASVTHRKETVEVMARAATPSEAESIWEKAIEVYRGYGNYARWTPHREIRVFVLEPHPATGYHDGD